MAASAVSVASSTADAHSLPPTHPLQSIPESLDGYYLTPAQEAMIHRVVWIGTEKVHGESRGTYNFSANQNNNTGITCTGRAAILDPDADHDHHGWKATIPTLQRQMQELAKVIQRHAKVVLAPGTCPQRSKFALYGEGCGGFYPDNPKTWRGGQAEGRYNIDNVCTLPQHLRAIQEGCYYSKERLTLAFKLKVYDALPTPSTKDGTFTLSKTPRQLSYTLWSQLVKEAGIPSVPFLCKGTYNEVCAFPYEDFQSRVPAMLGYEPLPDNTNRAEGMVIEPDEPIMVIHAKVHRRWLAANPDTRGRLEDLPHVALLIKCKSKKFAEVDTSQFQEPNMTPLAVLLKCASGNRANSVLSKHGHVTHQTISALVQEMADETEEDRMTHFPAAFIPFAEQAAARTTLETHCRTLLLQASGLVLSEAQARSCSTSITPTPPTTQPRVASSAAAAFASASAAAIRGKAKRK